MRISILVDTPQGWIFPWSILLKESLIQDGHSVILVHSQEEIPDGEIAFFLGCTRIVKSRFLARNSNNIVVHPSDLPRGRGFSPLAWQILEGENDIPVCLFEATADVDAGPIYLRDVIHLEGTELNEDIKKLQGEKTLDMCLRYVREHHAITPELQDGEPTFYPKRTALDSELDIHKTLLDIFPLLRIVDNERYPAFFYMNEKKYILRIEHADVSNAR